MSVALPPDAYKEVAVRKPGTWIVYMGRYPDAAQLADKVAQIKRIGGINFEHLRGLPQLEPGLSLGRFSDRASAETAVRAFGPNLPAARKKSTNTPSYSSRTGNTPSARPSKTK